MQAEVFIAWTDPIGMAEGRAKNESETSAPSMT